MNLFISQGHIVSFICSCALGTVTLGIAASVRGGQPAANIVGHRGEAEPVPITQLMIHTLLCTTSLLGLGGSLGSELPGNNFICYLVKALATLQQLQGNPLGLHVVIYASVAPTPEHLADLADNVLRVQRLPAGVLLGTGA